MKHAAIFFCLVPALTTQVGYGNGGHTYGDALTSDDRTAVIEYLKTL